MAGSCEHGYELPVPIEGEEFLHYPNDYYLLKNDCFRLNQPIPWRYSKNIRILRFITVFNYSMPLESTFKRMTPLHILPDDDDDDDDNRHHNLLLPRIMLSPVLVPVSLLNPVISHLLLRKSWILPAIFRLTIRCI
jgi:hypothetical protein